MWRLICLGFVAVSYLICRKYVRGYLMKKCKNIGILHDQVVYTTYGWYSVKQSYFIQPVFLNIEAKHVTVFTLNSKIHLQKIYTKRNIHLAEKIGEHLVQSKFVVGYPCYEDRTFILSSILGMKNKIIHEGTLFESDLQNL